MTLTLDLTQAAPIEPRRETSTGTNFKRIAWTRIRHSAKPGVPAEGRSIRLQTFVGANGPKYRSISMEGAVTEISAFDLMDEIRSIIRINYPSDMFEFDEPFSKDLEYALSSSHRTTMVSGLKNSEGADRGFLAISFGPR